QACAGESSTGVGGAFARTSGLAPGRGGAGGGTTAGAVSSGRTGESALLRPHVVVNAPSAASPSRTIARRRMVILRNRSWATLAAETSGVHQRSAERR